MTQDDNMMPDAGASDEPQTDGEAVAPAPAPEMGGETAPALETPAEDGESTEV